MIPRSRPDVQHRPQGGGVPTGGTARLEHPPAIELLAPSAGLGRTPFRWLDATRPHLAALAKRTFDLVASATALVLLLPLFLVFIAAIRISSPGPAVFRQRRLGRAGRTFTCLKFRTMHADAEARLERLLAADPERSAEWAATQKLKRDPRVTWIGSLLRRTSLDEIPQLINVIRGDMSLVGPRPIVEPERERYGAAMGTVLSVRPGLTGLWQVSGRNDTSYRQRIALDLRYVETRTLGGDLLICLRTASLLLRWRRNGAY